MHFCKIENFTYGEINEQSFSNPHLWTAELSEIHAYFQQCAYESTNEPHKSKEQRSTYYACNNAAK